MRTKVTLVLIFLNVALFFFIFKFERRWMTETRARDARGRVLGPEAADIRTLELTSTIPGASFALARRGENWWLTKPLEWPANPPAVNNIVNELKLLDEISHFSAKNLAANSMSLADYGLDRPKLSVSFTSGDQLSTPNAQPSTTLRIGDATPTGNRLYILSPDGETIHVVTRSLADSLSLGLDKLRADSLLTIAAYEVRALSVQTPTVRLRIRREAGSRWLFDTIINNARASKTAIDVTVGRLNALRVKSFNPATPPATLPSATPSLRVTLEGTNRRETLLLGDPVPASGPPPPNSQPSTLNSQLSPPPPETEYYAQLEGRAAVFTVMMPNDLTAALRNAQVSLREKHLLEFDARTVTSISLTAPNQPPLTLQRLDAGATAADATWQIVRRGIDPASGPQTFPADRAAVQRLLQQLAFLSAKESGGFVSDAPTNANLEDWGFNRPEREITLTFASLAPAPSQTSNSKSQNPSPPPSSPPSALTSSSSTLQLGTDAAGAIYTRIDPQSNPTGSIYAVDLDLRRELSVTPRDWRERQLPPLSPTANITALTLISTAPGTAPVYSHKLTGTETWLSVLAAEPPAKKAALEALLTQMRAPRAKRFVQEKFTDRVTLAGEDRPWTFKLEATVSLPGGTGGEQTSTKTLLFTDRVGGREQLAGSREFDAVFEIEQPLLDALWLFVYGPRDPGAPVEPKK